MEKVTEATLHLEKVTEAMAKCNLSLEYLKVTEAMAKCNLSLNYSQKIFWSDWTINSMNKSYFTTLLLVEQIDYLPKLLVMDQGPSLSWVVLEDSGSTFWSWPRQTPPMLCPLAWFFEKRSPKLELLWNNM